MCVGGGGGAFTLSKNILNDSLEFKHSQKLPLNHCLLNVLYCKIQVVLHCEMNILPTDSYTHLHFFNERIRQK